MSAPRFRNGTFKRTLKRVPGGRKEDHTKLENYLKIKEDQTDLMVECIVQTVLKKLLKKRLDHYDYYYRWTCRYWYFNYC